MKSEGGILVGKGPVKTPVHVKFSKGNGGKNRHTCKSLARKRE